MNKPKWMVHPIYAKAISSPAEQERLAAQGYYFALVPSVNRAKRADAANKRTEREAMRAAGYKQLQLWLSPEDVAVVAAVKHKGESYAACLARLARQSLL